MATKTKNAKKNAAPVDTEGDGVSLDALREALSDAMAEVEELEDVLEELKDALADGDAEGGRQILADYLDENGNPDEGGDDDGPEPEEE